MYIDRRTVLEAIGTSLLAAVRPDRQSREARIEVAVFPQLTEATRDCGGWDTAAHEAAAGVDSALAQIAAYTEANSKTVETVTWELRLQQGVEIDATELSAVGEQFRTQVRERGLNRANSCQLLLNRAPFNSDIGYGNVIGPSYTVAEGEEGAITVANIGATEQWDDRAVTTNMAIHEMLHTFIDGEAARQITGSGCDHNLGTTRSVDGDTVAVTPLATAYTAGDGTTWDGTGCVDPDLIHSGEGTKESDRWEHTTDLSEETLQAVMDYVERNLAA